MTTTPPYVIWFTGLSGSGKTTLAKKLLATLKHKKIPAVIIDGDEIRKTISKDLSFSKKDIEENHRRIATLIDEHLKKSNQVIVSTISPHREVRDAARKRFRHFIEIFCDCPIEVCMKRDPKGHYRNVRSGAMKKFIGVHSVYERPKRPDITVYTAKETSTESLKKIMRSLEERFVLNPVSP